MSAVMDHSNSTHVPVAEAGVFVLFRAVVYAALFIGFALIYVPASLMSASGISRPSQIAWEQLLGIVICAFGGMVALWCVFSFPLKGKGTPAPFDPPRHLVTRGPYRILRNPMYLSAGFALAGAALYYGSILLGIYAGLFVLAAHLFVVLYEEPVLKRTFGHEYEDYSSRVRRWLPHR
jgi:protein-S-isoprenylcysteine O-methyltransferase Ste14